ncbi:MAG: 1-deoxy-D-xylulose-5-phosphate reductoisomerase [Bacteroidetes bacterium]|nr:1-deoxy-D-xylulose-5-phosphate reductoisomerase [Bacteroidota bacterium]MCW5895793.1 1-deoxy-D-xylulose-5-phosphate reductoisomerase [Bacteroidota bacterium]
MRKKNIAILGSTGSIGRSTLDVISLFPDRFRVTYLTGHKNIDLLQKQILQFNPRAVVVLDECNASVLRKFVNGTTEVLSGEDALCEIVQREDVDVVVSSLVGFAGLKPTLHAIQAGKDIALANKETLVVAGEIMMKAVKTHGVRMIPVDSEHSAILQCLQGEEIGNVERLILTASGGPFRRLEKERFSGITVADALNHPTWSMGNKITIDSATLMNKGLEVIEAHWLFGLPPARIDVVIHPQSIIHSMVEFKDGSTKAQLGMPDMKVPIQYALMYPDRPEAPHKRLDFSTLKEMTFDEPDYEKFKCLDLAFTALEKGGTATTVLNAANEVAVQKFLNQEIPFSSIPEVIEEALLSHTVVHNATYEQIVRIDAETRQHAHEFSTTVQ